MCFKRVTKSRFHRPPMFLQLKTSSVPVFRDAYISPPSKVFTDHRLKHLQVYRDEFFNVHLKNMSNIFKSTTQGNLINKVEA